MNDTARRYMLATLREGRVVVLHTRTDPKRLDRPHEVIARVDGHRGKYRVTLRNGVWACTCTEAGCGHVASVRQVTGHGQDVESTPKAPEPVVISSTVGGEHTVTFAFLVVRIEDAASEDDFAQVRADAEREYAAQAIPTMELQLLEKLWIERHNAFAARQHNLVGAS